MNKVNVRLLQLLVIGIFYCSLLSSCARKMSFAISETVPAAQGSVKVKKDGNNNYAITVDIKNLAEPDRLQPPKKGYLVWMETERNGVQNLGQLRNSGSFFSSAVKANLETVTSYYPVSIFLTAEDEMNILMPTTKPILTTVR